MYIRDSPTPTDARQDAIGRADALELALHQLDQPQRPGERLIDAAHGMERLVERLAPVVVKGSLDADGGQWERLSLIHI